jgi:hypothetical protein
LYIVQKKSLHYTVSTVIKVNKIFLFLELVVQI